MIIFTDNLGALAFEIYLFDKKNDLDSLIASAPSKNKNFESLTKLLQIIYFNPTKIEFIAKPDGFPIEATDWTCKGDCCDTINIVEFQKVEGSSRSCSIIYQRYLDSHYLQVFLFKNNSIVTSRPFKIGSLGGESGYDCRVEYKNIRENNSSITGVKISQCDSSCEEFCSQIGLKSGKHKNTIILLSVNQED